jgi:hypothetical protein
MVNGNTDVSLVLELLVEYKYERQARIWFSPSYSFRGFLVVLLRISGIPNFRNAL